MNPWWRWTRTVLMTAIIPAGLIALGFYILGPRMSLMPRLDSKGWEDEMIQASHQPEPQPTSPVIQPEPAAQPVVVIEREKSNRRRKRRRTSWQVIAPASTPVSKSPFDSRD